MRAVRIHEFGGPEKLVFEEVAIPQPAANEVRIRVAAAGVNFVDTYQRSGLYPLPLPNTLGKEGAGVVDCVGEAVEDFKVGDRVGFAQLQGAYADYVIGKPDQLVLLPDDLDFGTAAAALLQGMTAHAFTHDSYRIKAGDTVLVHAGAGGTGALVIQMAKLLGARVLTTVSTEDKARIAREAGADEVILYTQQDFLEETKRLTNGKGVNVVYDSVGKDTYAKSLKCLAPLGTIVFCGNASGPVPPIDPLDLMRGGSLTMTRPNLMHFVATKDAFRQRAAALFELLRTQQVKIRIGATFSLEQVSDAHTALTSRASVGKLLIAVNPNL
eukprot:TRINITY_DN1185_c0_g2_i2.p1 TRINITY_DN1185_c0_g2~~TRINITY_DN1185_c0_g2_i2.p1  ORF type:complete len:327 (-),score=110.85 TRINITY_DN1185_c0_g2_i2:305-1285(-)